MQTVKFVLTILFCITLLVACGNKGPLYLPEEEAAVEQISPTEKEPDEDNKKKKESAYR